MLLQTPYLDHLRDYHPAMGWVALWLALALFVVNSFMPARIQTRYLRLYRERHPSEPLLWADDQPWRWRRDGRAEASLLPAFCAPQDEPDLEHRGVNVRRWQLTTLGTLALTVVVAFADRPS